MYQGTERKQRIKKRVEEYKNSYEDGYEVDKESLVMKAKLLFPFLKIGWVYPIELCSKLRSILK